MQVDEVPRLALLQDHPAVGEPFLHVFEERAEARLALAQRLVRAELGQGDGELVCQPFPQANQLRPETAGAPAVELQQPKPLAAEPQGDQGHRFVALPIAAVAGATLPVHFRGGGQQVSRAVGPETPMRGEEGLGRVEPPANHIAAHAGQHRIPALVPGDLAGRVPATEMVFRLNERRRKTARLEVRIILPLPQPDTDGIAAGLLLKECCDRAD